MDKLFALPVSGDSYLLQRRGRNILVDGGHGSKALASALSAPAVAVNHLHAVVCTHADKDHAGGLTDFLDKSAISVDEFWLPGAWSEALPELLRDPSLVVDRLIAEFDAFIREGESEQARRSDEEEEEEFESRVHASLAIQRQVHRRESTRNEARTNDRDMGRQFRINWLLQQVGNVELDATNDTLASKAFRKGRGRVKYRVSKKRADQRWADFWLGLIDTAERIRKIAVQAIRHNVSVRWFDFGEYAKTSCSSGGNPGLLVPLNAVELVVPPPPIASMLYVARLTPVNEECLVFFSPGESLLDLGVVFTGDSPLGAVPDYRLPCFDSRPISSMWIVATAPHHGSESNAAAYAHLEAERYVALWLRSGGSSKHPGATFRALDRVRRGCTHCPRRRLVREVAEVQLSDSMGNWGFRVRAHDCNC